MSMQKDFLFCFLISSASAIELNATQFNDFRFNFSAFYSRLKFALNGEHAREKENEAKEIVVASRQRRVCMVHGNDNNT